MDPPKPNAAKAMFGDVGEKFGDAAENVAARLGAVPSDKPAADEGGGITGITGEKNTGENPLF
ncbi:MAG: hypothetical protein M3Z23_05750 [Acidobacteriota bacterium]|nr:hypothetical protein [Acidobacteriota bacterium]